MVIYHGGGCSDGFGSAAVIYSLLGDKVTYVPAIHGDNPPDVTGHNVFIVDFSYTRAVLEELYRKANKTLVLDHHKSAEQELSDLDYTVFDMDRSGVRLSWDYVYDTPAPAAVNYIQDRDLWKWELDKSREFFAGSNLIPQKFPAYLELFFNPVKFDDCIKAGTDILENDNRLITRIVGSCGYLPLGLWRMAHVNSNHLISEVGNTLAAHDGVSFALVYFYQGDKKRFLCSLRSIKGRGADVSLIAKKLGGGGHHNASGFTYDSSDVEKLLASVVEAAG